MGYKQRGPGPGLCLTLGSQAACLSTEGRHGILGAPRLIVGAGALVGSELLQASVCPVVKWVQIQNSVTPAGTGVGEPAHVLRAREEHPFPHPQLVTSWNWHSVSIPTRNMGKCYKSGFYLDLDLPIPAAPMEGNG